MSSKQNPDKVCIRLKNADRQRLMKVIDARLEEYEGAYRMVGYDGYAEYTHGVLGGITWGLQLCGASLEFVDLINQYISKRMTEIEEKVKKEREEDEREI